MASDVADYHSSIVGNQNSMNYDFVKSWDLLTISIMMDVDTTANIYYELTSGAKSSIPDVP